MEESYWSQFVFSVNYVSWIRRPYPEGQHYLSLSSTPQFLWNVFPTIASVSDISRRTLSNTDLSLNLKNKSIFSLVPPPPNIIFHQSKAANNGSKTSSREQKKIHCHCFLLPPSTIPLTALKHDSTLRTSEETEHVQCIMHRHPDPTAVIVIIHGSLLYN